MQGNRTFIFHREWWMTLKQLSDEEAGRAVKKLCEFAFTDNKITLDGNERLYLPTWSERMNFELTKYHGGN